MEEFLASHRFVGLADRPGRRAQSSEGAKEATVALVGPRDPAVASPSGLADPVEAPVVTDPEVGVCGHVAALRERSFT